MFEGKVSRTKQSSEVNFKLKRTVADGDTRRTWSGGFSKRPTWNCMKQKADTLDKIVPLTSWQMKSPFSSGWKQQKTVALGSGKERAVWSSRLDFAAKKKNELQAINSMISDKIKCRKWKWKQRHTCSWTVRHRAHRNADSRPPQARRLGGSGGSDEPPPPPHSVPRSA